MGKYILGFDPGAAGALSFYNEEEMLIFDMPFYEITKGKTKRKRADFDSLCRIVSDQKPDHAFIEKVSAQFGNGAASAFSFGWACCAVECAVIACKIPFTYVTPQKWKKDLDVPADKDGARYRASQLLPRFSHNWERKKDHNRAEAALISLWGYTRT